LAEQDEQQGSYSLKERFDGDFKRVITLPEDVDTDSVEANYEDGVLHIRVAKPVVSQPRQIQINVN
jgi:HSP20 family protein